MVRSVVLILCVSTLAQAAVKLSDFVSPCSLKDPQINECLKTQAQAMIPHLVKGVRNWGILPMDPLALPHLSIQQGSPNSGGLSFNVTEVSLYGWKDMTIRDVKFNPKKYEFDIKFYIPVLKAEGMYQVAGQILVLPIKGEGISTMSFKGLDGRAILTCEPETRGKETYLKVVNAKTDNSLASIVFNLDNLFGNKALSDNMNAVLTENSLDVYKDLKVPMDNTFADIISTVVSRMFKKVPLNQLFKDV